MNTMPLCPNCGKPLAPNAPKGPCPECLMRGAFPTNPGASNQPPRWTPPQPDQIRPHFPQLEILELVGAGGMGAVYKACQKKLDRIVALKILPLETARDPAFEERFSREARALARLNHPNIVAIYDFGQSGAYFYFIMEFVDGTNLRQLIETKKLGPQQALELVMQICTALQFAHDENIVHRDIKPENILINKRGQVKIADFGLAKLLGVAAPDTSLTASQTIMGTLNYMAPEQRESSRDVDHRADIYSLGVVFYEMLTGEVPLGRFDPPSKKVQVDVRLDEVVLHALEREPGRRYQHVSEVRSNVEAITSSLPLKQSAAGTPSARGGTPYLKILYWLSFVVGLIGYVMVAGGNPLGKVAIFLGVAGMAGIGIIGYFRSPVHPLQLKVLSALALVSLFIGGITVWTNGRKNALGIYILVLGGATILGLALHWYVRLQDYRAQQAGLRPPASEAPTLDHVRRAVQAGEKILAIKIYREVTKASLRDAKSAVEKMEREI